MHLGWTVRKFRCDSGCGSDIIMYHYHRSRRWKDKITHGLSLMQVKWAAHLLNYLRLNRFLSLP